MYRFEVKHTILCRLFPGNHSRLSLSLSIIKRKTRGGGGELGPRDLAYGGEKKCGLTEDGGRIKTSQKNRPLVLAQKTIFGYIK